MKKSGSDLSPTHLYPDLPLPSALQRICLRLVWGFCTSAVCSTGLAPLAQEPPPLTQRVFAQLRVRGTLKTLLLVRRIRAAAVSSLQLCEPLRSLLRPLLFRSLWSRRRKFEASMHKKKTKPQCDQIGAIGRIFCPWAQFFNRPKFT
jgi:hypothetical protein